MSSRPRSARAARPALRPPRAHLHGVDAARRQQATRRVVEALREHDGRRLAGRRQDLGLGRQLAARAHDDPHRVPALGEAHVQLGVVAAHGAGADHDGVGHGAQLVHGAPAGQTRDPLACAAGARHLAVQRHGRLVGDQRQPGDRVLHEGRVLLARRLLPAAAAEVDLHAGLAQPRQATPIDQRVRDPAGPRPRAALPRR